MGDADKEEHLLHLVREHEERGVSVVRVRVSGVRESESTYRYRESFLPMSRSAGSLHSIKRLTIGNFQNAPKQTRSALWCTVFSF